jgi:hypothetical protein
MVRKPPAYMTEILLEKCVKWNKQTNKHGHDNIKYNMILNQVIENTLVYRYVLDNIFTKFM